MHCVYDPDSRSGRHAKRNKKVKATLHWVSQLHVPVRWKPGFMIGCSPCSILPTKRRRRRRFPPVIESRFAAEGYRHVRTGLAQAGPGAHYQFERLGYFFTDPAEPSGAPVFNFDGDLRDGWGLRDPARPARVETGRAQPGRLLRRIIHADNQAQDVFRGQQADDFLSGR